MKLRMRFCDHLTQLFKYVLDNAYIFRNLCSFIPLMTQITQAQMFKLSLGTTIAQTHLAYAEIIQPK